MQWQQKTRTSIAQALSDKPLDLDSLPELLRREAISPDGKLYQIKVYPKEDVWDPVKMQPFIEQTRSVDPDITGSPVQIYESGLLIQRSYKLAGVLALAVVAAFTFFDFLSVLDTLLCLVPVGVAFVMTFGLMYLAGVSINPANVMVLPLMFGIGVASGVHILHRYRQAPHHRPLGLSAGTYKGVILTNVTTIIAFASMLIAQHRGIRSLGFVLSVGISLNLIACLLIMPPLLVLRNRWSNRGH